MLVEIEKRGEDSRRWVEDEQAGRQCTIGKITITGEDSNLNSTLPVLDRLIEVRVSPSDSGHDFYSLQRDTDSPRDFPSFCRTSICYKKIRIGIPLGIKDFW